MFLIDLSFVEPLEVVDKYVTAHREYLSGFYARGLLLLGGRKQPRTGGIILSRHASLAEVKAVFDADPLVRAGAATYTVTEFEPVLRSAELTGVI